MQEQKNWKFHEYEKDEVERNSSSDKNFEADRNESFIRELIQNSLDAIDDKQQPVEVCINEKELPYQQCKPYFQTLEPHYKASEQKEFPKKDKVKFLILEDFNTIGLKGERYKDFLYKDNIRSDNNKQSGGSHGMGKVVLYEMSKIKTFFAYSIFSDEEKSIFEGAANLKTHEIDGEKYKEDGRLALDTKGDKTFIKELFKRETKQKGLSIAIPFVEMEEIVEMEENNLKDSIKAEYYYPIIDEKLVVKFFDEEINSNYILEQEGLKEKLISDYKTTESKDLMQIDIGDKYKNSNTLELTDKQEEEIVSKLEQEKLAFIKFNFDVMLKNNSKQKGYLHLLIQRNKQEQEQKFDFWREKLLINKASSRISADFTAIVLIGGEGNQLSILLRKLEDPGHTKWNTAKLPKYIKDKYTYVPKLVTFITQLPKKIIDLSRQLATPDSNFFSDYFPDSNSTGKQSNKGGSIERTDESTRIPDDFEYKNIPPDGFSVSLSAQGQEREITQITIRVAYGTNKGTPFENYDKRDFDFRRNININVKKGKTLEKKEGNKIICEVKDYKKFKISLLGFDPDRELKIWIE